LIKKIRLFSTDIKNMPGGHSCGCFLITSVRYAYGLNEAQACGNFFLQCLHVSGKIEQNFWHLSAGNVEAKRFYGSDAIFSRRRLMQIRKSVWFFCGVFLLILAALPIESAAGVNVNIGVFAPPPVYRAPAPPPVVVIPGTYVYMVPDIAVEILFYHGYWYRPYEGRWYRGKSYNGPWAYLAPPKVPRVIVELPPNYRRVPPGHQKIPYGQLKKSWGKWERDKHWDKDANWREGRPGRPEERGNERREDNHGGPPPGQGHGGGQGHGDR